MGMLFGWILILVGVIFFFAGGGAAIIHAILSGQFSRVLRDPHYLFSGVGFAIWLAGAVMMLAGWIGFRREQARAARRSRKRKGGAQRQ